MNKRMDPKKMNLEMMKRFMTKTHPGVGYKIREYKTYYTAVLTSSEAKYSEPIVFSKKGALPLLKTYAQMPREEGEVIFES